MAISRKTASALEEKLKEASRVLTACLTAFRPSEQSDRKTMTPRWKWNLTITGPTGTLSFKTLLMLFSFALFFSSVLTVATCL